MKGVNAIISIILALSGNVCTTNSRASPSTATFMNVMTVCAAGSSVTIDANLEGSILSTYEKSATRGRSTQVITTEIQKLLPQTEAYRIYVGCLKSMIDSP